MELAEFWPWLALAALGAYHGVNPAMGWLFAVALGLQEQSRPAVLRAFAPIVLGHAVSVAIVVTVVSASRTIIPIEILKWVGAGLLIAYGLYKLWKNSHPRWVGMRVGFKDLTSWSFLMASAHGAGLMLVPVLFNLPGYGSSASQAIDARELPHSEYMLLGAAPSISTAISQLTAIGVHTVAMFAVMAVVAIVVYEKVGLALLRKSWFNMDRIWAGALVAAGLVTLVVV
ncbi:MAG: hypothetical protein J4G14_05200 [Dehalococcoidia bacterium]|nr:hypothetical protein [Dehalococcoidia bacterium]